MIDFGQAEIAQLTREIWGSMLQIPLAREADGPEARAESINGWLHAQGSFVGGCVQITGAWKGAVRIDCSSALGGRAAAAFLGVESGEVSQEQVRDAVGELVNMSAGSIKSLLPRPSYISLPSVVDGDNYELSVRNSKVVLTSLFENNGQPLLVTVIEAELNSELIQ